MTPDKPRNCYRRLANALDLVRMYEVRIGELEDELRALRERRDRDQERLGHVCGIAGIAGPHDPEIVVPDVYIRILEERLRRIRTIACPWRETPARDETH
jgi:hypothetical protein